MADAFSTALVMQNAEVISAILEFIPTIDFSQPVPGVRLFSHQIAILSFRLQAPGSSLCFSASSQDSSSVPALPDNVPNYRANLLG